MATSTSRDTTPFQSEVASTRGTELLLAAIEAGLQGNSARMQQLLRRSLRDLPDSVLADPVLAHGLAETATHTSPPVQGSSRDRLRDLQYWRSPTRTDDVFSVPDRSDMLRPDYAVYSDAPNDSKQLPAERHHSFAEDDLPDGLALDVAPATEPVLAPETADPVRDIIREHGTDALSSFGLSPTSKVILIGPPGTGKTICARWIAHQLDLPLLTLNLAAVMSSELGQTAKNLTACLRFASAHQAVLFIDEFDAIASARTDPSDVGEVRRLVNVLLIALDRWPGHRLLLAATNHPELLDTAIERRFEETITFTEPNRVERTRLWKAQVPTLADGEAQVLAELTNGMTGAGIERCALRTRRRAALRGTTPTLIDLIEAVATHSSDTATVEKDRRRTLVALLASHTAMSQRQIARTLNISHTAVQKMLASTDGNFGSINAARVANSGS